MSRDRDRLERLSGESLTYSEVGATAGSLPAGYHHVRRSETIGNGSAYLAYEIAEERRIGFAYGTLPGHPERGEESFVVELHDDDRVRVQIVAFSRPARWFTQLGGPISRRAQSLMTNRYVRALRA